MLTVQFQAKFEYGKKAIADNGSIDLDKDSVFRSPQKLLNSEVLL